MYNNHIFKMKKFYLSIILIIGFSQLTTAQQKFDAHQLLTDIKILSSDEFEGRMTDTPGNKKAQDYIIKRFVDYKLIPFNGNYKDEFKFDSRRVKKQLTGYNLIGYLPGKKDPNKYIIICAHYDHLGINNKGEIYNGADDNASGVAGMFSVADYYTKNPPDYSVIFIAFDAEEHGLMGAKHLVKNAPFDMNSVVLSVNIDMISISPNNELFACGTYHYPFLKPYINEVASNRTEVKLLFGHDEPKVNNTGLMDWTQSSDHGPFHNAGVPFIYFGVDDHAHYHNVSDTFDKINQLFFINTVDIVIDMMINFDENLPKIIEEKEAFKNK